MSDHKGARLVLGALPPASHLIADRGYDSAWFREELEARGMEPCIPSSRSRKVPFAYDTALYRHRHKIENLLAKLRTLAAHRNPLRPMRTYLLLGHMHRSRRHLLALINES